MMEPIAIWGASGHAMVVADIIRLRGKYRLAGFLDSVNPQRHHTLFDGAEILGGEEQLGEMQAKGIRQVIVAIGDCEARLRCAELARSKGFELVSAIHPSAVIASNVKIGAGTVVAASAVINPGSRIGENVIINTAATIDHECLIGDGAHISPGTHLAGKVTVGRGAWIGIGACVIQGISIGSASVIGAGAVVVKDIPDNVLAYGNPATVKTK
jgi:UDP-N-acetylbacillosamine N-acetyltransferase